MMARPWLPCFLLSALTVSGGCLLSPTRTAINWGPSAGPLRVGGLPLISAPQIPQPGLVCGWLPAEPGRKPSWMSWAEGWPQVGVGVRIYRGVQYPVLCVPTVAANMPPTFADNMTAVELPEDLPVGESWSQAFTHKKVLGAQATRREFVWF